MSLSVAAAPGFPPKGEAALFWLGQAGFWIDTGKHRILIDPYLSDSLARKYAGTKHPHQRMMARPVTIAELPSPDLVLVTHAHTDHMDAETLAPLHARFPDLPFIVPAAKQETARERIGAGARLIPADADERLAPLPGLEITVFPAAHETLERDAEGRHLFLGFGIASNGLRIYHSGDCIPFDGLAERIAAFAPHVMLLPVNGRDAARLAEGIPGNFTLKEAVLLAQAVKTPFLVAHHFGMFAFNTIDPAMIEEMASAVPEGPVLIRPRAGERLRLLM